MRALQEHRAANSALSDAAYASKLGISRPFLIDLLRGDRQPSLEKAKRIEKGTDGAVRPLDWPNLAAQARAFRDLDERGAA